MEDRLFRDFPRRRDQIHSFRMKGNVDGTTYLNNCRHQFTRIRALNVPQIDEVLSGNYQCMARSCGIQRKESNPARSLADFLN